MQNVLDAVDRQYPEHAKLAAIHEQSQAIGAFLAWVGESGGRQTCICTQSYDDFEAGRGFWPVERTIADWLAIYFGIDQRKLAKEKKQMLEEIQALYRETSDGTK